MSRRNRSNPTVQPDRPRRGGRYRLLLLAAPVAGVGLALALFGRGLAAAAARHLAAGKIAIGAITPAQQWLAWSAWLDSADGRTDLMQAVCFRRLREVEPFLRAMESAERKGAPAEAVQQQRRLARVQAGEIDLGGPHQVGALIEAGLPPDDVAAAFVYGFLFRDQPQQAKQVLDAWAADRPEDANVAYMTGIYWQLTDEPARAIAEFHRVLRRQPRHELARIALAELLEDEYRLRESVQQYLDLANQFPTNETARVGLARLLRKQGRIDEARGVLEPLMPRPEPAARAAGEMAQIALESDHYGQVERWFGEAKFAQPEDREDLCVAVATALAIEGEAVRADRILDQVDAVNLRRFRMEDLQAKVAADGNDRSVAAALRSLMQSPAVEIVVRVAQRQATSGPELYTQHCAACHGENGDGNGRAARHVYPPPRDLRTERFRLVSTANAVPSLEDVEAVIRRGMPGTPHPSCSNVPEDQLVDLVQYCRGLSKETKEVLTNHERARLADRRAYLAAFGINRLEGKSGD
ncbi:MAG: tetratricopeptide repeat protein [Rhodopirellula sp.]|nr:tetratricopeptide repeat protein [Rhodopirellula sp.]